MKVLVTGGAGFIGSHCVDALQTKGAHVTVLDDFSTGREGNLEQATQKAARDKLEFKVVRGSVSDAKIWDKLPRFDVILHLAAQTSVVDSLENPDLDFDTNVLTVKHLFRFIRKHQVRTLIYTCTAGAIYGKPSSFPTDEREPPVPLSPYGATKVFLEQYIGAFVRALKDSGELSSRADSGDYFSWASLRLGNVYGPRELPQKHRGVVPTFVEKIAKGEAPTIYGDGTKSRDYIYVEDCVDAIMAVFEKLQTTALDDCFNVGTGVDIRDIDVFDAVLEALHARANNPGASDKVKKSLEISEPLFRPARPGEIFRSCLNINKIEAFLDWRPRVDFKDGIVETVEAYPI